MKKRILLLFIIIALSVPFAYSHEGEENFNLDNSSIYPIPQMQAAGYGLLAFSFVIVVIILMHKKMNELTKKVVYYFIVGICALVTLYLIITTLHLNIISETKGPVHWHADFEIWACGNEIMLKHPEGFSNKQGTDLMHAHDDNRIHVEGVLLDKKQASLGAFFYAVGGSLSDDSFVVPTDNGLVSYHEGDKCSGKAGKLYVFVNGQLINDPSGYVIAPYEKVPPGDRIKFVFTEKPLEEINPNIG